MLYIVSTPIGNLKDISQRAIDTLISADVILVEDTRRAGLLLNHFQIPHKPLISFYDQVEDQKRQELLDLIASDQKVALISDAGTPLISDPGYKLVRDAIQKGIKVEAIPGPTALISALVVSGLPPDRFLFLGYPPEKKSHQVELFHSINLIYSTLKSTVIFYVAPHKLHTTLTILQEVVGDRPIVLVRELTKIHEEHWSGNISQAITHFSAPRGEFVLLFNWTNDLSS